MPVDPIKAKGVPPHNTSPTSGGRSGLRQSGAGPAEPAVQASTVDTVQLSAASRRLVEPTGQAEVPQGTLSAARLASVLRRLGTDFYDSPAARADTARCVLRNLDIPLTE